MSFWETQKITVSVNMIGNCFGRLIATGTLERTKQTMKVLLCTNKITLKYVTIIQSNEKRKKKKAQKATKSLKKNVIK